MNVKTLNCPNCGAGVASDSSVCEFCKTRLKTVACPNCLDLMFEGSKFCDHCGAPAVAREGLRRRTISASVLAARSASNSLQIDAISLRQCEKCDGLWSDVGDIREGLFEQGRADSRFIVFWRVPKLASHPA